MRHVITTCLGLCLLAGAAAAELGTDIGFRLELPERYDVQLHVAPGGHEHGDGSQGQPFGSIGQAVRAAAQPDGPLADGRSTRIVVAPGTYSESLKATEWPGKSYDTLLAIEGESGNPADVILKQADGHPQDYAYFAIPKSALVIRHLSFTDSVNHRNGGSIFAHESHQYRPEKLTQDWLIENCVFRDGEGEGIQLRHVDHLTMRDCKFHDLASTGLKYVGVKSLFEDIEIYNTNTKSRGGFNTGGSSLLVADCVFRRIHIRDIPHGAGFRQDHGGENILVEDSIFERCAKWGVRLETAKGPITIRNSVIRDNGEAGFKIDTGDQTITNCLIVGNPAAIQFQSGHRYNVQNCVPPGYGCIGSKMDVGPGERVTNELPLFGVDRVVLLNNTIISDANNAMLIDLGGEEVDFWQPILTEQWVGRNNVFFAPNHRQAFSNARGQTIDFDAWRQLTGTESYFGEPANAPAGYGATLYQSEETSPVRFEQDGITAKAKASTHRVQVIVPQGQRWSVEASRDWVGLEPEQGVGPGEVTVSLDANPLRTRRGAAVVLNSQGRAWDLMVQQGVDALAGPTPPPTDLVVKTPGEHEAHVTWSPANVDTLYGYGINYRAPGGNWMRGGFAPAGQNHFDLEGLLPATEYEVRIRTIATDGVSGESDATTKFTTAGHRDPCEIIGNGGFASGSENPWMHKGRTDLKLQQHTARDGYALLVQMPEGGNKGVRQPIKPGLTKFGPGPYRASAWIKVPQGSGKYKLEFMYRSATGNTYVDISDEVQISDKDGWVKVEGTQDLQWDQLWQAYLHVQAAGRAPDFVVDDVSLQKVGCGE